ncbi:HtaA domain-containing protein [Corynebacterium pseudodiphtheriticum]|uniref:HtaA domain-containing protein n=1 Tax=Corynebacterium pseudodiphtheriticum TaxID=37637 RepID=UPI00234E25F7|nr:HtaA domain-containing protein [Corynebacterium pseudodiphtheriticum]MDC7111396.1 HtaA domain-containing protein [Corynebacterium pseudodiphtheriticum]MDC7115351.1 HtaA domain-containing protein [Corynebacterium pseudodiphtheriticum]
MAAKKPRRISSVGIALGLFSLVPALTPIAGAQTGQPAIGAEQAQNVATENGATENMVPENGKGSLNWALRDSFLRYSLGATNVGDGATKIYSNGTTTPSSESDTVEQYYKFNLKNASFEDATHITRAEFEGSIEYFKYCEGKPAQRGNCSLELTIKDPTIVLSPEGSYVEADVRSKQYPSGEIFEKEDAKIANAWTKTAKFEEKDGKVSWEGINTSLTEDGVRTFSNFYDLGGPLAPLSFEYEGKGARPGNDSAPLTIGDKFVSAHEANEDTMIGLQDYVVLATRKGANHSTLELIDPATMQSLGELQRPLPYNESQLYTKGAGNRIYWVEGQTLKAATASAEGWSDPMAVAEGVGVEPAGIAYDAANDRVGIIARGTNDNDSTLTWVTASGEKTTATLTAPQDVVKAHDEELFLYGNGYNRDLYGEIGNISLPTQMNVMPDGNILYLPASAVNLKNGSYRVPPLLIHPDGTAKLADGGTEMGTPGNGANYATEMATDGNNVAFYSQDHHNSGMQFFRYEDGVLKPQSERGVVGDLKKVSEVAFVGDKALVTNEATSQLSWVNPETREIIENISLPNQKDTAKKHRNLLQWKDHLFAYSIETNNETYLENAAILRLDSTDPQVGDHTDQVEPPAPAEPENPQKPGAEAEGQAVADEKESAEDKKPAEPSKPSTEAKPADDSAAESTTEPEQKEKPADSKKAKDGKKSQSIWERISGLFSNGFEKLGQFISQFFNWLFKLGNGLSS